MIKRKRRESELKFTHENHSSAAVKRSLDHICIADKEFQNNTVNSVYFDTHDWMFALEKASSDYLKTKVRLRWYQKTRQSNDKNPSKCFLEFKSKIGSKREKSRVLMPFSGKNVMQSLQTDENKALIQQYIAEKAPSLVGFNIKPKFVVKYNRHRYFEPLSQTRVSLDTNIQAFSVDRSFAQIFSKIRLNQSVLEVKGNCDALPVALRTIHAANLKKAAFSKYYESFILLTGYQQ